MKAFEMSSNQRIQLIEMCREFFPEYKDITTESIIENERNPQFGERQVGNIEIHQDDVALPYIDWSNVSDFIRHERIHWYEFTLLRLTERLYNQYFTDEGKSIWNNNLWIFKSELLKTYVTHPVELLFELVKSYKKDGMIKGNV